MVTSWQAHEEGRGAVAPGRVIGGATPSPVGSPCLRDPEVRLVFAEASGRVG